MCHAVAQCFVLVVKTATDAITFKIIKIFFQTLNCQMIIHCQRFKPALRLLQALNVFWINRQLKIFCSGSCFLARARVGSRSSNNNIIIFIIIWVRGELQNFGVSYQVGYEVSYQGLQLTISQVVKWVIWCIVRWVACHILALHFLIIIFVIIFQSNHRYALAVVCSDHIITFQPPKKRFNPLFRSSPFLCKVSI